MAGYQYPPGWQMLVLPAYPVGVSGQHGTSVMDYHAQRQYRDFRYVIPFIVQFGLMSHRSV